MKRYLMRGGMSQLSPRSPADILAYELLGANSGNLLYAFGVFRTLMTEDVQIDMDEYGVERHYNEKDIAEINEKYDAYICPLADAFRDAFEAKLFLYARFFSKLKIPVYVIGLGVRTPYEPTIGQAQPFDAAAKEFIRAVLRHNTLIGLRGHITGEYLTRLGFKEGQDFDVIGCPSMYMNGRKLEQRPLILNSDGTIPAETRAAFNMSSITPVPVLEVIEREMKRFPDSCLIEQTNAELRLLYYGITYRTEKVPDGCPLPMNTSHPLLQEDRYKYFINLPTWFEELKNRDLCMGSKLHGNIAGVVSGCPSLFIALDGRMRELCEVHHLPNIPFTEVKPDDTLESMMARVDMQSHLKVQAQNFDHFIDFLDRNGLDHIYKADRNRTDAPVDALMKDIEYPVATSILKCSQKETIRRFNQLHKQAKIQAKLKAAKPDIQAKKDLLPWVRKAARVKQIITGVFGK